MASRGEQTREHLLDVAERLFGERGLQTVSLREIRIAAGARNTAAMQFYFGDRDGLIDALMERHMPRIAARQQRLYDRMVTDGREDDTRSLVEVLVRPGAEYLNCGPGERAWVKIMGELSALPDLRADEMQAFAPEPAVLASMQLFGTLCEQMPRIVARRRIVVLVQSAVQICADRARIADEDAAVARRALPMGAFTENLVDMIHGALFAPVSAATAAALAEAASTTTTDLAGDADADAGDEVTPAPPADVAT
jgi:AcrR family transcriptional regulator